MRLLAKIADRFKEEFKRYKKRDVDLDLSDVIDFNGPQQYEKLVRLQEPSTSDRDNDATCLGLIQPSQWTIYSLISTPGLLMIPNPFKEGCQHYWVKRCLVDYPCNPNICSLDAHVTRERGGQVWPEGDGGDPLGEDLLYKLRWVTLGYHYDWNTKEYYDDRKSPFPSDLAQLSSVILRVAGLPKFTAEAAIVNFYHLDSTLSGHTDHSERDLSLPLLSISFGQSAVFLIGGESKSVRPQAILLHSGDVVIMSGQSRTAYHGVPKIICPSASTPVPRALTRDSLLDYVHRMCASLSENEEDRLDEKKDDVLSSAVKLSGQTQETGSTDGKSEGVLSECTGLVKVWTQFERYFSTSRINVNVRQVNSH